MQDLWRLTACEGLAGIRNRHITITQWTQSLLDKINSSEGDIRAWVYLDKDAVLQKAQEMDAVPFDERGPLHGLPIGVKDVMLTKDMPTQYNSRLFESDTPIAVDAAPVAVLRQSGALIFGKLTTTEFACSRQADWHQNHTRNARAKDRTPGGSSSGSGAAVASSQIPIALGTQTGGSIIRPASFNGCYGFKPTWNVISREGLAQWCLNLDTCGFFSRCIEDLELIVNVFQLAQENPLTDMQIRGARIGFCRTHNWVQADADTVDAMERAQKVLAAAGADVGEVELPEQFTKALNWHAVLLASEGRSAFLSHYLTNSTLLHEQIQGYVEGNVSRKDILQALDGLAVLRCTWDSISDQYDAILTPSVPGEAPLGIGNTGDMSFCSMWTALHVPALNIPWHHGSHGLPVGLTLVGARLTDRRTLRAGKIISTALQNAAVAMSKVV